MNRAQRGGNERVRVASIRAGRGWRLGRWMMVLGLVLGLSYLRPTARAAAFLFDATKAETAGNADWVIDQDSAVVGRYPTPAASGITAATTEGYWLGALSAWGVALVQRGHTVESLPVGGRITYGDATNAQDLSFYRVFVVCEPNILFTAAEKSAIVRWVRDGGALCLIGNHAGSDRNNDGDDPVEVWNDLLTNNGVDPAAPNPFGFVFNFDNLVQPFSDIVTTDPAAAPFTVGPAGTVTQLKYSNGATQSLNVTQNPTVRAVFWKDATRSATSVLATYGELGLGRFFAVGDSSPSDDGTGQPGNNLFFGWTELGGNHARLYLNASAWLAAAPGTPPLPPVPPGNDAFGSAFALTGAAGATTSVAGPNTHATLQPGEPLHGAASGVTAGASVWWRFTAAHTGTAVVTTSGSSFDTVLAVYTGTAVGALSLIASNDNDPAAPPAAGLTSRVSFPTVAGTVYRIAVAGRDTATGLVALAVTFPTPPAPANDAFAAAIGLAGAYPTTTGTNAFATKEPGEPDHAYYTGGRSVWWRWTAPTTGAVKLSTVGSSFDTLLAVYTGDTVSSLVYLASDDESGGNHTSRLTFGATAGTSYALAVDGWNAASGSIVLTIAPPDPPVVGLYAFGSEASERGPWPGYWYLSLDYAPAAPLTVALTLTGTALPDVDYTLDAPRTGAVVTVTVPAGQSYAFIDLTPLADADPTELTETAVLTLAPGAGYTLSSFATTGTITITDDTPYTAAWLATAGPEFRGAAAALLADFDGDGLVNLLEFAFGGNPSGPEPAPIPPLQPELGLAVFADPADGGALKTFPTLTFHRRIDTADTAQPLAYAAEFALALDAAPAAWSSEGVVEVSVTPGGAGQAGLTERVTVRSAVPMSGAARQFGRVRVTTP